MTAKFIFIVSFLVANLTFGQFKTRIYNIYSDLPFNQQVEYNDKKYSTKELSVGGSVCVGNTFLNTIIEYNYHKMDLTKVSGSPTNKINIHEILFGLRYYPARPTFMAGRVAFRLTAGWSGGFDFDLQTRSMYFMGFAITGVRQPSGILIQGFYRRSANPTQGYQIQPYFGVRLGLVIGPSSN